MCVNIFLILSVQHKKLNVEGGGEFTKDLRKGQKQGDLEIWDPVDEVLVLAPPSLCNCQSLCVCVCVLDSLSLYVCQRWKKHYCVIMDDKLYYAEEEEEQEEDSKKVSLNPG